MSKTTFDVERLTNHVRLSVLSPILWHGNRYGAGNGVIWLVSILLWIGNPYSAGSGLIWLDYGPTAFMP